ncbi:hypothetical protein BGZ97_001693, partial [Linnemannia gamsii]
MLEEFLVVLAPSQYVCLFDEKTIASVAPKSTPQVSAVEHWLDQVVSEDKAQKHCFSVGFNAKGFAASMGLGLGSEPQLPVPLMAFMKQVLHPELSAATRLKDEAMARAKMDGRMVWKRTVLCF